MSEAERNPEDSLSRQAAEFVALYSQYEQRLFRYVATLLPRRQDAEDVLQEAARVLWTKFHEYDPARPFLPWACRVAYYEVLRFQDQERTRRRHFSEAVLQAVSELRIEQEELLAAQSRMLDDCLHRLRPDERQLLRERYAGECSIVELAEQTGRTADALYKSLERLRKKLLLCVTRVLADAGWMS